MPPSPRTRRRKAVARDAVQEDHPAQLRVLSVCGSVTETFEVEHSGTLRRTRTQTTSTIVEWLKSAFLPDGFPDSVSGDYLVYQKWDTFQAGTLATHAVLKGVGVGDDTATATAAAVTWLLRDGAGMVGRIAFAWYEAGNLDADAKRWRLTADVLNDAAIMLELASPHLPRAFFVPVACAASVARSIVGVAGGASRAALTQHQARRNNSGDVAAKDGSQETLVNLAALLVGLVLVPAVGDHVTWTWALFALFTLGHVYANYRAVTSVVMDVFNRKRAAIFLRRFVAGDKRLSPADIAAEEPLFSSVAGLDHIVLGASLHEAAATDESALAECFRTSDAEHGCVLHKCSSGRVFVLLAAGASSPSVLSSYWHGLLLSEAHRSKKRHAEVVAEALAAARHCGWNVERHILAPGNWRFRISRDE